MRVLMTAEKNGVPIRLAQSLPCKSLQPLNVYGRQSAYTDQYASTLMLCKRCRGYEQKLICLCMLEVQ